MTRRNAVGGVKYFGGIELTAPEPTERASLGSGGRRDRRVPSHRYKGRAAGTELDG